MEEPSAADRMLALILELLPAPGQLLEEGNPLETAADGSSIGLYHSKWQVLTCATFAFGEAVQQATQAAVAAMARVVAVANSEIDAHVAATDYSQREITESVFGGSKRKDWCQILTVPYFELREI